MEILSDPPYDSAPVSPTSILCIKEYHTSYLNDVYCNNKKTFHVIKNLNRSADSSITRIQLGYQSPRKPTGSEFNHFFFHIHANTYSRPSCNCNSLLISRQNSRKLGLLENSANCFLVTRAPAPDYVTSAGGGTPFGNAVFRSTGVSKLISQRSPQ